MSTIMEEITRQSQNVRPENFICATCKYHTDGYGCQKGVFVAFQGANMSGCGWYELGKPCPHCGRMV